MEENKPVIHPIYDRAGNLQRKMELMARYIGDIKGMLDYYGWIFAEDPWFAQRLREAEDIYAGVETAFKESIAGLEPADEATDEKIRAAGQYIIRQRMSAWNEHYKKFVKQTAGYCEVEKFICCLREE